MVRKRSSLNEGLVALTAGAVLLVATGTDAQSLNLRNDGIGFPDGSVQKTAAPVVGTPIDSLPFNIDTPGYYYLTGNLTHTGSGESIEITANDVTIDFSGNTLTKENAGNYTIALDGDYTNFHLKNGTITGGNIGVRLRNEVGDDFMVIIENMVIRDTLNEGIHVQGQSLIGSSQLYIRHNSVHDVGNDGIYVRFMWGGKVVDNVVQGAGSGAGDHGIYLHSCRGVTVRRNTISHSGADGIRAWYSWYCTFDSNHMTYNNDWGLNIFAGDSHVFSTNRAYGNGDGGFTIPGGEGHVNAGGNYPPP